MTTGVFKARGIVLREQDTGEADKSLTFLLKERGRLRVNARGARKPASKLIAAAQQFAYSDIVVYQGRGGGFHSLTQADLIESFHNIRYDYDKLALGQYLLEICEKTIPESAACDEALLLLLKSLTALSRESCGPDMVARCFEFKFFAGMGMAPEVRACTGCGSDPGQNPFFGPDGAICEKCALLATGSAYIKTSRQTLVNIHSILCSDIKTAFNLDIGKRELMEIERAAKFFMRHNFEIKPKAMEEGGKRW